MQEQDLAVARALAAESRESSPGGSPAPLRKTILTNLADKLNTFRKMAKGKSPAAYSKRYYRRLTRRKRRTVLNEITAEHLNNNNLDSNLTDEPSCSFEPNGDEEFSSKMMDPGSPLPPLNIELLYHC